MKCVPLLPCCKRAALAIVLALQLPLAWCETLVLFGSENYAPISALVDGKPRGVFPELLARLEAETGDHYDLQLLPWNRAQALALKGEGGIANISWNSDRAALFDFSVPLYEGEVVLVVLKGKEFRFDKLSDLKGKTIGAGAGSSFGDEVDQAIAQGLIAVDRDPGQTSRMHKLLAGRVDAILVGTGRLGVRYMINSEPELKDLADRFMTLPHPVTADPLYVVFPKAMKKKDALERLNKAYLKLRKAGALTDILGHS